MAIESVVVESVVSKIAELLAGPVKKQFRYMFCFNNFVQEFNEQVRSLVLALYRLQVAVDDATKNAEEIEIYVNTWLEDAKKALALYGLQDVVNVATKNAEEIEIDVNKWLEDAKNEMEGVDRLENEKGKCFTWCPKWIRQFKLSKALEKKTETLRKLEEEGKKFQNVAHKVPLQDIEFLPSKELTPSESSKEAFEQIMKALKDDNINMIGLYGMGGVGKTTLVKEVGRRAKEMQLFDEVLMATLSQNPNVIDIQDRMAESLGLHFDEETTEGRTNRLWQRLKTENKLLVILDDVWQDVDLKEMGIPFGDDHRGCKVLLTTRLRGICFQMQCQQQVPLSILSENEAWALFKINAGLRDEDSNLNTVAEEVARECQGLPIALVTVGRALRDKSLVEWEVASTKLKHSQLQHIERNDEEKNTYACLKLSYDYLKHEETKLCFLLCCLFPEEYDIPIEDLTRYAVGYGLHQDVESIEDARKQVYVAIKTLKDCCMLLGTETEESVKMHDVVRDVAIQIASSKEHGFMVKAGIGLKEWPMSNKSFEGCTTISLMGNKLAELPEGLVCPRLKVLLLELDDDLNVPERFFEGMKGIEVLSLKGGCLSLKSLEFSTNLKSLLLIYCECNDLIWLRKLQRLQILGFIGCSSVKELPDEIGELKELQLLDVSDCNSLIKIPANLIGRLKKLEELLIRDHNSFEGWSVVGCDSTGGMNASLTELNLLSHLAVLSLKIPRVECIPRDFVFPRLLRYDIMLGDGCLKAGHPTSTSLCLGDMSAASLNAKTFEHMFPTVSQIGFINVEGLENIALSSDQMTSHGHGSQKDFFQRLKDVKVQRCRDTRTLFPAKWLQALNNLTSVEIGDCESLEVVFELGEAGEGINEEKELLSSLTRLELKWLPELKCIWKGPTRHVSLRSLIHLELWDLNKLTFIFTPHLAQSLVHLETLQIVDCSGLKHLIRENDDEREIIPESLGFQKLKTLFIHGCDKLEYVFPISVSPSLLNLEEMTIAFGDNLKQIFYRGEGDALTRDGIINFPQLRELSLSRPKNFTAQLPSLQVLAIEGHEELGDFLAQLQGHTNLREIHIRDCKGAQDRRTGHELSLLSLEELRLWSLPDMRFIWKGLVLSHLTTLVVYDCQKLTHVFTCSMVASLVQLKFLNISDCSELEQIIAKDNDDEKDQILSGSDLQSLCFPNLCKVEIKGCNKLRCIWKGLVLSHLTTLEVRDCEKLTHVFTGSMVASLVQLKSLKIRDCSELEQIIAKDNDDEKDQILSGSDLQSLCFPNLRKVYISGCNKLTFIFTPHLAQSLVHLETLEIYNCSGLKHLIGEKDDEREIIPESLGFPKLKTLSINRCDKLEYVFPVSVSTSLLNLEDMRIEFGDNLKQIFYRGEGDALTRDGIINFPQQRELSLTRPTNFTTQLPSLQLLYIEGHEELGDLLAQLQGHTNLRKMCIKNCKGAQDRRTGNELSLLSLEELELNSMPDMRCIWKGLVLSHLTTLKVRDCQKLTHVFTGSMVASLVQLQFLRISDCEELEQIIAKDNDDEKDQILSGSDLQSLCFPNLCEVYITGCNKLRSLFPVAMAAGLPKLQRLEVGDSSQLLGVFWQDDHASPIDVEKQMVFPTVSQIGFINVEGLESIALSCDQMTSNGHGSQKDFLQRLEDVHVYRCRDIRTLFPAKWPQALNNLTSVEIENCESLEEVFELGEAEEGINEEKELSSLTRLELTFLPELKCIWKGPTSHVSLRSLIHLKLEFLDKLTFIFTPHLAQSLVHLETLRINYCSGLKHLISENDDEREIIPEFLGFPKLKTLSISRCNELEYVFPVTVSPSLLNLEEMEIAHCANLKQIFYSGEGHAPTSDGVINFPRLRELSLLSGCSFFGPKNFTAHVPSLQVLYVREHEELGDLLAQLQGQTNLRKITIKDMEFLPSMVFTPSESSKEAFEQMMKALKDDNVNMIELYGMGGVGKTTLVKEVGRRAKETQLFDEVLLAAVSQNPNVMYIQDRMAESLGLQIDEKTIEGRANRLWQRLKIEKKLLVILDDVWKVINLKEIGIPFGDDHRGCKILLTTRLRDICSDMECQQKVFLSILSENEAWALFKINAGLRDEDCNLNTVAKKVVRECQGLPIALVTVGRALRDKSTVEWEVASKELKNSQFKLIDEKNIIYSCLKLSYDYLKHEKTKLCFLLCCLFPEDYNIPIEDLTRYSVGYGLHQDVESIEDARKQVYVAIKTLKDCCMLLGTESEKYVKMHDMVRDVAIQIASSKEHGFMVKAGIGLKEWPMSNKSFEGCTTISLMGNKLAQLPEGLVCPQLKVLLLELDRDLKVPERFFEGMKEIEVLSLEGGCLSLQSLEFSTNLQSLLLIRCKCNDLIWLRKLQRLQILGFIGCISVEELPDEIRELKELRLLDMTGCSSLRISVNMIGRLKKLEELLIEGWGVVGCDSTRGMNASLTELNLLSHLAVVSLKIPDEIGELKKLRLLDVTGYRDTRTLFPAKWQQTLNNLTSVKIEDCKSLEEVFELLPEGSREVKELRLLSSLTMLELKLLPELKYIWKGPTRHVSLRSLIHLELQSLYKLTFIFTLSLAQSLDHLETLQIEYCTELKHLIRKKDDESEIIQDSLVFPKLKTLSIRYCDELEFVFPVSVSPSLLNLEEMEIVFCDNLKQIFYRGEGDALTKDGIIDFPQLRKLTLLNCCSCFGPKNFTAQLPSLQVLYIEEHEELGDMLAQLQGHTNLREILITDCEGAQEIMQVGSFVTNKRTGQEISLLSLEKLDLSFLPDMRCIWKGLVLSHLTTLEVCYCQKLTHVFTCSMVASLLQLQFLKIFACEELEQIIAKDNDDEKDHILSESDLQSLCFPHLCKVEIKGCNKLRSLFPVAMASGLPKLETLDVSHSSQLLGVFGQDDDASLVNAEKKMVFPNLSFVRLYNLPSIIVCFSLGCDDFLFSRPEMLLMVDECPKLTTKFARKTNGSMSAPSEVLVIEIDFMPFI